MTEKVSWKFFLTPPEAVQAMYDACSAARISIDFEQYIIEDNEQGRWFIDVLAQKAAQGVRVRLLCDASGSSSLLGSPTLTAAEKAGVQVRVFNPIKPWLPHKLLSWFLRDHRKLAVIDGKIGFIGGVNIRMYVNDRRDTHVRIEGPVIKEFQAAFNRIWEKTGIGKRMFAFDRPLVPGVFTLLTNSPYIHQRFTYWAYVRQIRAAKKYIYITTPYFIPDWRIFRALKGAARRGVDVRIIVPNSPDWKIVRFANTSFYARALRVGIRIMEFGPQFNHAKTCVIDDAWACVGSSNMDSLSLLLNYEADLAGTDSKFVADLKNIFEDDLKQSAEILRRDWRRRPFLHKLLEQLLRPLHRFI
jgi:cardiolipin synthase